MNSEQEIINPSPDPQDEFAEFRPVIRSFARKVVKYGLTTPAIILCEAERPLNWIIGQAMHVANPTLSMFTEFLALATHDDLDRFARFLEDRRSFDVLIQEIEKQDALKRTLAKPDKSDADFRVKAALSSEELR